MSLWASTSAKYNRGWRRGSGALDELGKAYRNVFSGNATREEAQMVLADFNNWCGFNRVMGQGVSADDRAFADGMRAAYGRIHRFLRMSEDEIAALEKAARQEALADSQEGIF